MWAHRSTESLAFALEQQLPFREAAPHLHLQHPTRRDSGRGGRASKGSGGGPSSSIAAQQPQSPPQSPALLPAPPAADGPRPGLQQAAGAAGSAISQVLQQPGAAATSPAPPCSSLTSCTSAVPPAAALAAAAGLLGAGLSPGLAPHAIRSGQVAAGVSSQTMQQQEQQVQTGAPPAPLPHHIPPLHDWHWPAITIPLTPSLPQACGCAPAAAAA